MAHRILLLPGDGIGPEVVGEVSKLINVMAEDADFQCEVSTGLIGGAAVDARGAPLPDETLQRARAADAVLLGAVGAPQYDDLARELRPERGLLAIRKELNLFANLRPAMMFPGLAGASTLRPEVVRDLDLLIVRELTGGIYFGRPRGARQAKDGGREAFNTMVYHEDEIRRIAAAAFEAARARRRRLCSVDKANVLEVSELWRAVVDEVAGDHPDVEVTHMYVDNAAMQLVREPRQFDVLLASNMFGDILSDLAAMLTGSIGLLPSASLNAEQFGLYEPVHGAAPDIAGQNKANPLAAVLSFAMLLRHSLGEASLARRVEQAVRDALREARTADLATPARLASTAEMGDAVARAFQRAAA